MLAILVVLLSIQLYRIVKETKSRLKENYANYLLVAIVMCPYIALIYSLFCSICGSTLALFTTVVDYGDVIKFPFTTEPLIC